MEGVTFKKPKHLEEETVSYIRQLEVPLADAEDEEDREILVENCFKELRLREASASCNKKCSFIVEKFLAHATPAQLVTFVNNIVPYVHFMMYSPYASHVLQRLLELVENTASAIRKSGKEDDPLPQALDTLVLNILDEHFLDHMCNATATHVVRSSWRVLTGHSSTERRGQKPKGHDLLEIKKSKSLSKAFSELPSAYQDNLNEVVSTISSLGEDDVFGIAINVYGGPALSDLLTCLSAVKHPKINSLFRTALGLQKGKDTPGYVRDLAVHAIGSHVVETVVQISSDSFFEEMFERCFRGDVESLARDNSGNYVLQQALACCRTIEQADSFIKELLPLVSSLFGMAREGVLVYLVALGGRSGVETQRSIEAAMHSAWQSSLGKAAKSSSSDSSGEYMKWLLDWKGVRTGREIKGKTAAKKKGGSEGVVSSVASQIVKATLTWKLQIARRLLQSLVSFPSNELVELTQDPGASRHIMEPLITASQEYKWVRQKFLAALRGHWDELSGNRYSCWFVQKAFTAASKKYRTEIASELAERERKLSASPYGKHVLRHCKVEYFLRDPEGWAASFDTEAKTNAMHDVLKEVDTLTSLAHQKLKSGKKSKKKGKSKKESKEEDGSAESQDKDTDHKPVGKSATVEPFMAILGFGGKGGEAAQEKASKSKKKKKEKKEKSRKRQKVEQAACRQHHVALHPTQVDDDFQDD